LRLLRSSPLSALVPAMARKDYKWQVQLAGKWEDFSDQEHRILNRAYFAGFNNCRFKLRGTEYVCDFAALTQKSTATGKERRIRPPYQARARPAKPLLPEGRTMCIRVPEGASGTCLEVPHPDIAGGMFRVKVPETSRPGSTMMVPVPKKAIFPPAGAEGPCAAAGGGLIVADKVSEAAPAGDSAAKDSADGDQGQSKMTTGQKVAVAGGVAVGAAAVFAGGMAAGAEIAEPGSVEDFFVEAVPDMAEDVGDWVGDAAEDVGDFFMDLF